MSKQLVLAIAVIAACAVGACRVAPPVGGPGAASALADGNAGDDWPGYGRTYGEQHYGPQSQINPATISSLGLAWSYDLPAGNPMSAPIEVGGVLYTATGYSIVRAFDAPTGRLLWTYDPHAPEQSGRKLREGWGIRGLAAWDGKLFVGTQDGRLIALDAKTGRQVWSVMTLSKDDYRFISGAPRVFDGKVIIGHGGADAGDTRGYVTTYDARTGRELWRFFLVPGDPAKGFENDAMRMAAKTWSGEWWKYGGGGTAWNSFTYDAETDTILIGTGNGAPWNQQIRSAGKGDNLFLCSIVALDAKTGAYKWHYQFNPGESWDYNASMDMQLADLSIGGKPRKVVMEAPKNGFLYVIDRINGKLISADKITYTSWASRIDLASGRPVENPAARFPDGKAFDMFPGPSGAHTWLPSAFSPKSRLVYLPVMEAGMRFDPHGYAPGWQRPAGNANNGGFTLGAPASTPAGPAGSILLAWNPATGREAWRVKTVGPWNGGVLATGGGLVFQGEVTGAFNAYDAASGKTLWHFDAQAPVLAPPITYRVNGRQYVTVLAGLSTSAGLMSASAPVLVDYRTEARRVLTFALGGKEQLAKSKAANLAPPDDPTFVADSIGASRGAAQFLTHCMICHGPAAIAGGSAPDLRASTVPISAAAFEQVVREGALVPNGMPRFEELQDAELTDIREYLRSRAADLRKQAKPQHLADN